MGATWEDDLYPNDVPLENELADQLPHHCRNQAISPLELSRTAGETPLSSRGAQDDVSLRGLGLERVLPLTGATLTGIPTSGVGTDLREESKSATKQLRQGSDPCLQIISVSIAAVDPSQKSGGEDSCPKANKPGPLTDLPLVLGPKLHRYRPLVDPLDVTLIEELHKGGSSHIWKVSCRGYFYALKLVRFQVSTSWRHYSHFSSCMHHSIQLPCLSVPTYTGTLYT